MLLSTHMKGYTNLFIYATKDLLESFNTNSKEYNIVKHYYLFSILQNNGLSQFYFILPI